MDVWLYTTAIQHTRIVSKALGAIQRIQRIQRVYSIQRYSRYSIQLDTIPLRGCTTRQVVLQLHEKHRRGEEDTTVLIGCTQSEMSKRSSSADRGDESGSMSGTPFCRRARFLPGLEVHVHVVSREKRIKSHSDVLYTSSISLSVYLYHIKITPSIMHIYVSLQSKPCFPPRIVNTNFQSFHCQYVFTTLICKNPTQTNLYSTYTTAYFNATDQHYIT